jgi:hypothetical protein
VTATRNATTPALIRSEGARKGPLGIRVLRASESTGGKPGGHYRAGAGE